MLFKFHNNILSVVPAAEALPEIIEIRKLGNCKDILEYVYFVHDRTSIYNAVIQNERVKIVRTDKFAHLSDDQYSKLEEVSANLVSKLEMLQYTANEKLLKGIDKKIGEYLDYWNNTSITSKNHKQVAETIHRAEGLLKIKERLEKIVGKEKTVQRMGGTTATLIDSLTK